MDEESIFAAALRLDSPDERKAYLDKVCGNNAALRADLDELFRADADLGSFINHPALPREQTLHSADDDTAQDGPAPTRDILALLASCDSPGRIGKLGVYEIIEVVGSGGMGTVLRGFDVKLKREVAVKVMTPHLAASAAAVQRFLREAQSAAAVHHEHVVTIYAVEDQHLPPFLVMEFVEGRTLQQKIDQDGPIDPTQILRLGAQIAAGLAAAHKQGLIHRDVKPANILLESDTHRVKITDFGLARAADDAAITGTGIVVGTPQYMSPEQAKGNPVDFRSDLFSLGSVLYAMCAGRSPFHAETNWAILRRVCEETPEPLNSRIPARLSSIIMRLLEKDPAARFSSAAEVADLLARDAEGVPSPHDAANKLRVWPRWIWGALAAGLLAPLFLWAMGSEGRQTLLSVLRLAGDSRPAPAIAPFNAAEAVSHQEAWAKHLGIPVSYTNSLGMRFRLIPPGEFESGLSGEDLERLTQLMAARGEPRIDNLGNDAPAKHVSLAESFLMGTCEVTVGQFRQFVMATHYRTSAEISGKGGYGHHEGRWVERSGHIWSSPCDWPTTEDQPVVQVGWNDAMAFCAWLSEREGLTYTLPRDDQWEFAARAGNASLSPISEDAEFVNRTAWHDENRPPERHSQSMSVGLKPANAFGLHDVLGNASEYCLDAHPVRPERKVTRGCAWYEARRRLRFSVRGARLADAGSDSGTSFRVAIVGDLQGVLHPRPIPQQPVEWLPARNLGVAVNTKGRECGPFLSQDGLTLFFHRMVLGKTKFQIYQSTRPALDTDWTPAELLAGEVNDGTFASLQPTLLADQCTLWFERREQTDGNIRNLWVSRRATSDSPWDAPRPAPGRMGLSTRSEAPALTPDGRLIVIHSNRPGGSGDDDLWFASRTMDDAPFADVVNMGPNVNTAAGERNPWISPDGLLLLFTSTRPDGMGGADIWMSRRKSLEDKFEPAENLGPQVNTSSWEGRPCLSSDGMTLMFESIRPGGQGEWDLWEQRRAKTPLTGQSGAAAR